eukprot:CAMPEP_0197579070 /NCGR_PEP_ID=MMETSP1326-20131121/3137_1 /TAXON_ID=1155430 /ORGANISM="Genus nov. species nov., Strain RCC2288" /LENGTH=466 /DNA_ID=CAMNT_0043142427 /DNA_START=199 /DNA_END=1595 /DNA_ORIENTATION=+
MASAAACALDGRQSKAARDHAYDPWHYPSKAVQWAGHDESRAATTTATPTTSRSSSTGQQQQQQQQQRGVRDGGEEFRGVALAIFREAGLLRQFGIRDERALRFLERVRRQYSDKPYHSELHAQDVLASAHCLISQVRAQGHGPISHLDVLALYVAALGHDAGHFGLNNAYLKNSDHTLHRQKPRGSLEHFHADIIAAIVDDAEDGLTVCLPTGVRASFVDKVRSIVLSTDMAAHAGLMANFSEWVDGMVSNPPSPSSTLSDGDDVDDAYTDRGASSASPPGRGLRLGVYSLDEGQEEVTVATVELRGGRGGHGHAEEAGALERGTGSGRSWGWKLNETQRNSLLEMTMKCADLANLLQELPAADFWGERIMEENLAQGARERAEGIAVTTTANRSEAEAGYFNHQAGFLEHVVLPMFDKYTTMFTPGQFADAVLETAGQNLAAWKRQQAQQLAAAAARRHTLGGA